MSGSEPRPIPEPLFELLCFMVVSARGLVDEPGIYGPFRLIDGASRLIGALAASGYSDEFVALMRERIDTGKLTIQTDMDAFVDFLDSTAVGLAKELKRRRS